MTAPVDKLIKIRVSTRPDSTKHGHVTCLEDEFVEFERAAAVEDMLDDEIIAELEWEVVDGSIVEVSSRTADDV